MLTNAHVFVCFLIAQWDGDAQLIEDQRTNGPVNAHLISWPSKAQNIQNLGKYMVKK